MLAIAIFVVAGKISILFSAASQSKIYDTPEQRRRRRHVTLRRWRPGALRLPVSIRDPTEAVIEEVRPPKSQQHLHQPGNQFLE